MNKEMSHEIDYHENQLYCRQFMFMTPIACFIRECKPSIMPSNVEAMFQMKEWLDKFPYQSFYLHK